MKRFLEPQATLIIANGQKPDLARVQDYFANAKKIIAVDGALGWLLMHSIKPDLVIGDMDSAAPHHINQVRALNISDQNSNDLEKAIRYCLEQHIDRVIILGAFGLRSDHFLTNLFVLGKFASRMQITFIGDHELVFICPSKEKIYFDLPIGSYVSIFPFGDDVGPIHTTGVMYPLTNERLSLTKRIGSLNQIVNDEASLYCESGQLLVCCERR